MNKRKPKVYFSVPVTYDWGTFKNFLKAYSAHFECVYWERGTRYNETELFADIEAIVILTPNNNWCRSIESLPSGVKKELKGCYADDIPVYLAYKPTYTDMPLIYNIDIDSLVDEKMLNGVAGTANEIIHELCTDFYSASTPIQYESAYEIYCKKFHNSNVASQYQDKRLLLL